MRSGSSRESGGERTAAGNGTHQFGHVGSKRPRTTNCFLLLGLVLLNLFGVMGAKVGCKFPVALQFEVALHFIEGFADGHTGRFESPVTFGATKTPKTLLINPYQLPAHDRLFRCAPANTCALSGDETFCFAINKLFRSGVLTDCSRKPAHSGRGGRYIRSCIKRWAEFTRVNL